MSLPAIHRVKVAFAAVAWCLLSSCGIADAETLAEWDPVASCECPEAEDDRFYFDVYGFAQVDYIQDFNRVNPAWISTLRPSRIPTEEGLFGADGEAALSVRQSRLGVKSLLPSSAGDVRTMFEFDLYGVGVDEGQTTFRLRHAYGEWGNWLGGQTHSLFMDINVFPNVIDYWGPAGMVFLRNAQVRWTPIRGDHTLAVAIEQPSSDIDVGEFDRLIDGLGLDVRGVNRMPNFTGRYRLTKDWGHFQAAGIIRNIGYETLGVPPPPGNNPKNTFNGWGVNLSGNINVRDNDKILLQYVMGEGIASYMNDGGVDLAPSQGLPQRGRPKTVPLRGIVAYYNLYWTDQWATAFGYSSTEVDNLAGQEEEAFKRGEYASINLLYTPADSMLYGIEYLWGQRTDKDGATGVDNRIQVSLKYTF